MLTGCEQPINVGVFEWLPREPSIFLPYVLPPAQFCSLFSHVYTVYIMSAVAYTFASQSTLIHLLNKGLGTNKVTKAVTSHSHPAHTILMQQGS